jgi:hypothetical protein
MKYDEFKKNLHKRVHLVPIPKLADELGREIGLADDEWSVDSVADSFAVVHNRRNDYCPKISYDQMYSYMADPIRSSSDLEYGYLILKIQIYMGPKKIWVVPNLRPGEPA